MEPPRSWRCVRDALHESNLPLESQNSSSSTTVHIRGDGRIVDQELFNDRVILVRDSFMDITPDSTRFEQTFSDDEGKTWETNWAMTFKRLKAADKPR
jgi:hypothetical protein